MSIEARQDWSTEIYGGNARFVADYGTPLVDMLAPRHGERILDLGCGDGALTERIIARGADVVGIDSSPDLLAAARQRGIRVLEMDGQEMTFEREFDGILTNAALHWMPEAEAVLDGVARALVPGGRFVGEFGGHGNVAAIVTALLAALRMEGHGTANRHPWFFATPDQYAAMLERAGFEVVEIGLIPRPTPLATGIRGWLAAFGNPFVEGLATEARDRVFDLAVELLEPSLRDHAGNWSADYVRLRFSAVLTGG